MRRERYTVYVEPAAGQSARALVGFSEGTAPKCTVVRVAGTQVQRRTALADVALSEAMKLVRAGWMQIGKGMYFDDNVQNFVPEHPDFVGGATGKKPYVLYAQPPDIEAAVVALDRVISKCTGLEGLDSQARRQTLREMDRADEYLVAGDSHPVWALALAQLALLNGWPLAGSQEGMPQAKPHEEPLAWSQWLSRFFAMETITNAQQALGWTYAERQNHLSRGQSEADEAEPMSAADYL